MDVKVRRGRKKKENGERNSAKEVQYATGKRRRSKEEREHDFGDLCYPFQVPNHYELRGLTSRELMTVINPNKQPKNTPDFTKYSTPIRGEQWCVPYARRVTKEHRREYLLVSFHLIAFFYVAD